MIKQFVFLLLLLQFGAKCGFAQKEIIYGFDKCVIDSLNNGLNTYSVLLKKHVGKLKLFILMTESSGEYELYLQEYSHLPQSGLLHTIQASNRKIQFSKKLFVPIIYPSDILSEQIKKDTIKSLPFAGYYLKVSTQNYEQKVEQVSMLF